MVIDMNETKLKTVAQISALLAGTADVVFTTPANEAARRDFISGVLKRFGYSRLANKTRGVLLAYMQRLTGYSRQHLSRLIAQHHQSHSLDIKSRASRTSFVRRYTADDIVRQFTAAQAVIIEDRRLCGQAQKSGRHGLAWWGCELVFCLF